MNTSTNNPTTFHGLSANELGIISGILSVYTEKIDRVCLFGSRANGKYKHYSDIDLVLYGNIEKKDIRRLYTLFDDSYLGLSVDIHAYHLIQYPPLKRHIDETARVLFTQKELR